MASKSGKKNTTVADQLYQEAHRFDFYQAVRILEKIQKNKISPAESTNHQSEPVFFSPHISLAFPPTDIHQIKSAENTHQLPAVLQPNVMGLAGVHGPLPLPYTELLIDRNRKNDRALSSFLDIFHHRLLSILYRQRKKLRIGMEVESPWTGDSANRLFALFGMGTEGLHNRMSLKDQSLLYYAGLLAPQVRGIAGLECLLADFFQIKVEGVQFQGGWESFPDSVHCYLGKHKSILGKNLVIGKKYWNQECRIILKLNPLSNQFKKFFPAENLFTHCCDLIRFYLGDEIDFELNLIIKSESIPLLKITTSSESSLLGWNSWLKSKPGKINNAVIRLPNRIYKIKHTMKFPGIFFRMINTHSYRDIPGLLTPCRFIQGSVLINQGIKNSYLYVLIEGQVDVIRRQPDNTLKVLNRLYPGDFFGEISTIYNDTPISSVVAVSNVLAIEIHSITIKKLIKKNEDLRILLENTAHSRKFEAAML